MKKLNADSLIALISEKDGTEKIEALNLLSNVICRQNIDSSILLATQAIELSEKLKYQKGLANGYFNVGNGYFLLDSLQPTISNYLKALRIYEDLEPTEEFGNLCNQLGLVNYFTGRMEVSMLYGRLALSIFNIINDKEGKAMANFSQGIGKHAIYQEYDSAIYYCKRALTFLDSSINQTEAAYIYREMGMIFFKQFFLDPTILPI